MTFVAGAAAITASALFATTPADAPMAARVGRMVSVTRHAPEAPVPVQSLGYLEFDWGHDGGVVPGFEPLLSKHDLGAGVQP